MKAFVFLAASALLALPACSLWEFSEGEPDAGAVVLVNRAGVAFYYDGWDLEASHQVDPRPSIPLEDMPFPQLEPGASAEVERIHAYDEGDDLRFFLYTLDADEATGATVARLTRILTVTHEELRQRGGRIVVEEAR